MKSHISTLLIISFVIGCAALIAMYPIPALILTMFTWVIVIVAGAYWYTYQYINKYFKDK